MGAQAVLPLEELGRIGERIYHDRIRSLVMPQDKGKFLVLDIDSADYEVDSDELAADDRLRERHPGGQFYALRIGYTTAYSLGGRMVEEK